MWPRDMLLTIPKTGNGAVGPTKVMPNRTRSPRAQHALELDGAFFGLRAFGGGSSDGLRRTHVSMAVAVPRLPNRLLEKTMRDAYVEVSAYSRKLYTNCMTTLSARRLLLQLLVNLQRPIGLTRFSRPAIRSEKPVVRFLQVRLELDCFFVARNGILPSLHFEIDISQARIGNQGSPARARRSASRIPVHASGRRLERHFVPKK